jgi:hypothetical protein
VVELLPASMKTGDMLADNPGVWLLHCHVADHMIAGMFTTFTINGQPAPAGSAPGRRARPGGEGALPLYSGHSTPFPPATARS